VFRPKYEGSEFGPQKENVQTPLSVQAAPAAPLGLPSWPVQHKSHPAGLVSPGWGCHTDRYLRRTAGAPGKDRPSSHHVIPSGRGALLTPAVTVPHHVLAAPNAQAAGPPRFGGHRPTAHGPRPTVAGDRLPRKLTGTRKLASLLWGWPGGPQVTALLQVYRRAPTCPAPSTSAAPSWSPGGCSRAR
jgi:hypothetical protein